MSSASVVLLVFLGVIVIGPSKLPAGAESLAPVLRALAFRERLGGTHAGWLSPAELKLVSEWTDIGAQYFNDPFLAPLN